MPQSKEQKRNSAMKLIQLRNQRTAQQQIDLLDQKLGKNIGATKERQRLQNQIANAGSN